MNEAPDIGATQPTPPGERRQVSVLFTDMVGYTAIVEQLGEERALPFVRMIYDRLTEAVSEHGGTVRGFAGDSIMAIFGIPDAQEDAALRACRTALFIQAEFAAAADDIEAQFGVRPSMRVGVSSGVVVMAPVEGEGAPPTAVGNTVNLASRIQGLARPGGCLICDETRRLVEWIVDLNFDGEYEVKGVTKPKKLWQLLSIREGATRFDASLARGLSHHVGRDDDLNTMADALGRARDQLCGIDLVAEPGLGKTRMVFEFQQRLETEEAMVLTGHCSADGQQIPFLPLLEVVRSSFWILDEDEPALIARRIKAGLRKLELYTSENLGLLLNLLGIKPPEGSLEGLDGVLVGLRTRDLVPALLKALCRFNKVVLLLEDIHWIDSASEELLRKLMGNSAQANLLVIHTRRPEYVPDWCDSPAITSIALKPLAANDIRRLAQTRLGVDDLPDALIQQVTDRAGGNPLFGEEILTFLVQQGALRIEAGKVDFDAALGESGLPASMQSLLTARIDRLQVEDRALLEAAAAIGRRFDPGLLSYVVDKAIETGASLQRLQAQDIVYRENNSSDYVFKHVLLRDTVYQSLVAVRRAELHLVIAKALEIRNEDRLSEAAETLAYHFGLTDRSDLAFTYNALAGAKSLGIFSLGEANGYFASALALYQRDPACADDERFAAFLADYALCSNISLRVRTLTELAIQVRPILDGFGDSRHHVHFLHHYVSCLVWNGRYLDALSVQHELSAMAERLGEPEDIAYALVSEMAVSCYCGQLTSEAFEDKRRQAEVILEGLDDAFLQNFFSANIGWNAVCRGRVLEAHEAAEQMIAVGVSTKDPRALGYGTAMKALIALISDDHQKALEMSEQALGQSRAEFERAIASAAKYGALVQLKKPGAVEELKNFLDRCSERGWSLFHSTPDTMLGVALAMDGRIDEGLQHIERIIARREKDGYQTAADWYRLFLCEVYLEILSGEGDASLGVLMRNIRSLSGVFIFGPRRIVSLVEKVRLNTLFDHAGHHIGRVEMILGLMFKIKKKKALAQHHLSEAHRIVSPAGPSPMLTRIDVALAELTSAQR
jgi:class 3 adenylate cyclase